MSKYRITIDIDLGDNAEGFGGSNPLLLSQTVSDAVLKEVICSHLMSAMKWSTSKNREINPEAADQIVAYHGTWANILKGADFNLEKICE